MNKLKKFKCHCRLYIEYLVLLCNTLYHSLSTPDIYEEERGINKNEVSGMPVALFALVKKSNQSVHYYLCIQFRLRECKSHEFLVITSLSLPMLVIYLTAFSIPKRIEICYKSTQCTQSKQEKQQTLVKFKPQSIYFSQWDDHAQLIGQQDIKV